MPMLDVADADAVTDTDTVADADNNVDAYAFTGAVITLTILPNNKLLKLIMFKSFTDYKIVRMSESGKNQKMIRSESDFKTKMFSSKKSLKTL